MLNLTDISNDLKFMIDDLPVSITYLGNTYSMSQTSLVDTDLLTMPGFQENITLSLTGIISEFPRLPYEKETVTVGSDTLIINKVTKGQDTVSFRLDLVSDGQV